MDETRIILLSEKEKAEKTAKELRMARNRACGLIMDAKARYIKEKTRAKSKKAALEKDALLKSPRFKALEEYDRFQDIQEAYGCDYITESERDRLEDLWEEREAIKNKTEDGIYKDIVTEALDEACAHTIELWEDEITKACEICRTFEKQRIEAEKGAQEWMNRQNAAYMQMFG
jgi:hypothetical protein